MMRKIWIAMLMAGAASFYACDSKTGGNTAVGGATDSEQLNSSSVVNPPENDTTGASATEKTQTQVGNSDTRGEQNTSNSSTTQNQELTDSM